MEAELKKFLEDSFKFFNCYFSEKPDFIFDEMSRILYELWEVKYITLEEHREIYRSLKDWRKAQ